MNIADIDWMDRLSCTNSPAQCIDSRAKLIVTVLFAAIVVSVDKYQIMPLVVFAAFPLFMIFAGGVPLVKLLRRLAPACIFAVMVGVFNPFFDRDIVARLAGIEISGGWVSFLSIFMRIVLTASAALILLCVTGIYRLCWAMGKLGVPQVFVVQIMFLHRYIFVLAEEILRMRTAVKARSFGGEKSRMSLNVFGHIAGSLLIRSIDRAGRIYTSMRSRGFCGNMPLAAQAKWNWRDSLFVIIWCGLFIFIRFSGVFEN